MMWPATEPQDLLEVVVLFVWHLIFSFGRRHSPLRWQL